MMTGRERLLKTLRGEKVDRVPIWLFETYVKDENLDEFTDGWMKKDKYFRDIKQFYYNNCEIIKEYMLPGSSRNLVIPQEFVNVGKIKEHDNMKDITYEINTPKGILTYTDRLIRDISTVWKVEYPVKSTEDIDKLLSLDFKTPDKSFDDFFEIEKKLGQKGVMMVLMDTPMVAVSGMMPFEEFLMYIASDFEMVKELADIAFERIKALLGWALAAGLGPIYRICGSEQATPPMNRIEVYNELVYNYEKELIEMIHRQGSFAAVHCHGKVREVLPRMLGMGVDLLDPVEPPPSGDVEFVEAKEIVDGKMTLAGNIEFDDLERKSGEEIKALLEKQFSDGRKDHVFICPSAHPLTYFSENLYKNHKVFLEEGMRIGRF